MGNRIIEPLIYSGYSLTMIIFIGVIAFILFYSLFFCIETIILKMIIKRLKKLEQ